MCGPGFRREKEHQPLSHYNPLSYFCYLFYVPLHFAGPTTTFNAWLSHVERPQRSYSREGLLRYLLVKVVFIFLVLEAWLHGLYVFALTNSTAFLALGPYAMALTSYFTLVAIWLKFTALWRFFRAWALLDGVEAPENMNRCVSNNYSIQSFWRAWHRSFNRWLVRYIYVPLGGGGSGAAAATAAGAAAVAGSGSGVVGSSALSSSGSSSSSSSFLSSHPKVRSVAQQSLNIFVTFSFVAFWHDRTMQLLAWGWLVALLFVPELAATALFNTRSLKHIKREWYWRHIKGIGAALSIFTMMVSEHTRTRTDADAGAQLRTRTRTRTRTAPLHRTSLRLFTSAFVCGCACAYGTGCESDWLQRWHRRHLVDPVDDAQRGRRLHVPHHLCGLLLCSHAHVRIQRDRHYGRLRWQQGSSHCRSVSAEWLVFLLGAFRHIASQIKFPVKLFHFQFAGSCEC